MNPERAIFIQIKQAGDCLLSTPAVRAFKQAHPGCEVHYLVERRLSGILQDNKYIDRLITIDAERYSSMIPLALRLRKNNYDIVFDFLSNPTSSKLAYAAGAKIRIGYNRRGRAWAYNRFPTEVSPNDYSAKDKLRLLEAVEISSDNLSLDFYVPESSREEAKKDIGKSSNLLAVVPVSRREYKRWSLKYFAIVLDRAVEKLKLEPLLLCGPNELGYLKELAAMMKSKVLIREMESFQQFGAYLMQCSMFLGNDNGPKHIAAALGIPTLAIFGHQNPANWTEPDNPKHSFVTEDFECKLTCNPKKCINIRCLEGIPPDRVYKKLKEHWLRC